MHRLFLLLSWLLLSVSISLHASQQVSLTDTFRSVVLQEQMQQIRLPAQTQLSDVLVEQQWQEGLDTTPLETQQALWLKVNIDHQNRNERDFVLSLNNPALDQITVYLIDDLGRILGSFYHSAFRSQQSQRLTLFHFSLWPQQRAKLLIKIEDDGPMALNMLLLRADAFEKHENGLLLYIGLIAGAMLILTCYFMLTYVLMRNPIRFWFALSCFNFALLYLNIQGVLGLYTGLQAYSAPLNTLIVAAVMFTASKFSFALLGRVPAFGRLVAYLLCIALLVCAFWFDAYWQLILSLALTGAALSLQMLLAWLYHHEHHTQVARLYASGWLLIGAAAFGQAGLHLLQGMSDIELIMTLIMVLGLLLLTVAVEVQQHGTIRLKEQRKAAE